MAQRSVRENLVDAGLRVFLEKGFHAASVNDLVADAGVPKGSFYNHFESKDALALEVVKRYVASYELESLRDESKSPLGRLRASFTAVIGRTVERGVSKGCLLGTFACDFSTYGEEVGAYVAASIAAWAAAVSDCLADAKAAGELGPAADPEVLGRFLVDAYEGAVLHARVSGKREPLDTFLAVTFETLLPTPQKRRR